MDYQLEDVINNCVYVNNCTSNTNKDISSLSYLIDRSMSQSECIKLGIGIENVLSDLILKYTNFKNIKLKNTKGKKETDHLFCDKDNKIIYYSELKANINLDTEKSKSTINKCLSIVSDIQDTYPDYEIKWCLLALRYTDNNCISQTLKKKYESIGANLYGINEYLAILNIDMCFNENDYKIFLNKIADKMYKT